MILKFGTKLDSDELYCVTKKQPRIAYQSLFLFIFSFSPMDISVTDFSAPFGASVFKFCVHLQVGKMYGVNENKNANPIFFIFQCFVFSFCCSYIIHMDIFYCQSFLSNHLTYDSEI